MHKLSVLLEVGGMIKDGFLTIMLFAAMFIWAAVQDGRVWVLRKLGMHAEANLLESDNDQGLRQLCGLPESGSNWD